MKTLLKKQSKLDFKKHPINYHFLQYDYDY
jgi:hypothetical protein